MGGYQIIKFIEENLVEVVPSAWLIQEGKQQICFWPNSVSQSTISLAIKSQQTPKDDWKRFLVRVLSKHPYESFATATAKANKATYTSCLDSDSEPLQGPKRQRKRNKRIYSSSENESPIKRSPRFDTPPNKDQYPTPPILQKNDSLNKIARVKSNLQDKFSSVDKTASNPTVSRSESNPTRAELNPTIDNKKCPSCIKQEDLFTQVIRLLHIINGRVGQNSELITTLINSKESMTSANVADDEMDVIMGNLNLPAKSYEELMNLDKQLTDVKIKQFLINKLVHVGGDNTKEVIKRIVPKLVEDEVLKQFSWIGGKGKKIFSNLHMLTLIKDVCKKNTNTKVCTEKEVEQLVAIFLTKATERCNRKKAKENNNADETLEQAETNVNST